MIYHLSLLQRIRTALWSHGYNESGLPSGCARLCSHPTSDTRTLMCTILPVADTVTRDSQTHLGLWSTARCDRAFWTEGLSRPESLPEHSGLFKPELFLNQGVGEARDGTRDDNTVFFTLRETPQWYKPNGIWQMRMSEAISSSALGEHEGTVLMLM